MKSLTALPGFTVDDPHSRYADLSCIFRFNFSDLLSFILHLYFGTSFIVIYVMRLTPGELVLRRHRPLHQLGFNEACAKTISVFSVVLKTHTHTHTD